MTSHNIVQSVLLPFFQKEGNVRFQQVNVHSYDACVPHYALQDVQQLPWRAQLSDLYPIDPIRYDTELVQLALLELLLYLINRCSSC